MNEPEDPESPDEEIDGSDAVGASVPWYLPGQEELDQAEELEDSETELAQEEAVEAETKVEAEVSGRSDTEVPLRIWCPDCGQELNISREYLGVQGMCLNCSLPIVASMRPGEDGSMRVQAIRVQMAEEAQIVEAEDSSIGGEDEESLVSEDELSENAIVATIDSEDAALLLPLPGSDGEDEADFTSKAGDEASESAEQLSENSTEAEEAGAIIFSAEGIDPLLTEEGESNDVGEAEGGKEEAAGEAEASSLPGWMEKSLESQQEQEISIVSEDEDDGDDEAAQEDEQESASDWDLNLGEGDEKEDDTESDDQAVVEEGEDSDDDDSEEELEQEEKSQSVPIPSWMKSSKDEGDEDEDEEADGEEEESEGAESDDLAVAEQGEDSDDDDSEEELEQEEKSQPVPIPSWMGSSKDEEEDEEADGEEEESEGVESDDLAVAEEGEDSDDDDSEEELEREEESQPVLIPSWMKSSNDDEGELGEDEKEGEEAKGGDGPSWADGGNPWDALGLSEKKEDDQSLDVGESADGDRQGEEEGESGNDPILDSDGEEDEPNNKEDKDADGGEDEDGDGDGQLGDAEDAPELDEKDLLEGGKESHMGLIVAVVIIVLVGGGALALILNPDLIRGKSSSKTAKDKQVVEQRIKADEAAKKEKVDKLAAAKLKEKAAKEAAAKLAIDEKAEEDKGMKVAGDEPKAVERPQGQEVKKVSITDAKAKNDSRPQPKMATAHPDIHDEVALRVHQEGERAIRRFYRTPSVEERSAFVLQPDKALPSMRAFYGGDEKLPTLRYVEFRGKVKDPTSGYRFGIFDVYEKENEKSHRWCVVEIEPGQYALDWGLFEQLESSTLVDYLAKVQDAPKKFRFLMKLGDVVSVMDSPWSEEAIKVYLKLPAAGGAGGEAILLKKSAAEKFGMLEELANGRMKIGQVELNWVPGDKDPGSRVPTITELEGWGAWKKIKLRGLR